MMFERLALMRDLLTHDGSIYIHLDPTMSHYVKCVADEIFGADNFHSEIVWRRSNSHNKLTGQFGPIHDSLLYYSKSPEYEFHPGATSFSKGYVEARFVHKDERGIYQPNYLTGPGIRSGDSGKPWRGFDPTKKGRHWAIPSRLIQLLDRDVSKMNTQEILDLLEKKNLLMIPKKEGGQPMYKQYLTEGVPYQDVWAYVANSQGFLYGTQACIDEDVKWLEQEDEKLGYPTQKPEGLIRRIVQTSSSEGAIVGDFFCGSGTAAAVAEKLNRKWIACDLSRFAIHTTRKRLLGIPNVRPFVVQNLGKYERQAWQVAEFPTNGKDRLEEQRQREAAYRQFILDLYHAKPITGHTWLHGAKSGRMVHVAAVDAPVTLADVKSIARETWKAIGTGKDTPSRASVDTLGWEFAFEVNELAKQIAAESRVEVAFKKIPREVLDKKAVEQGDVKFFELGALSVDVKQMSREITLKLTDFVIPTDDIPDEARKAIKHWSQLIDYWAADWDFKDDTFHNQWQSYRTRKNPKIDLETRHTYSGPGKYAVVVKVIDILGNDTTKTLDVTVK